MTGSPSFLANWIDRDFWTTGAMLCSSDGESITLGKGGVTTLITSELHLESPRFVLKNFFDNTYLSYTPESFVTISRGAFLNHLKSLSSSHTPFIPLANDDDLYEKDFKLLKSSFDKTLKKIVLISRETYGSFEGPLTVEHLIRQSMELGSGTPYGLWSEGRGMIGSTPEILFKIKDQKLFTFALAGTAKKGEEEVLLHSTKDREEHFLVVQDIKEKLSSYSSGIRIGETGISGFRNLIHLKTDIHAELNATVPVCELVAKLSPTAALGGYPMQEALLFLKGTNYFQKYPVRYFGSAFGLLEPGRQEFVVAIRNVQWEGKHLFIESGGGVLPESDYQKELSEIHLKRNTIRCHYL
jgi:menaquinone-specific isochorismate synthase